MSAPHRLRRTHLVAAAFAGLVLVAVMAGPAALAGTSLGRSALGSTDCASAADARVGLAIDFGDKLYADTPPATTSQCLVPSGNGLDLLKAAGHTIRLSNSSLLCAIDGYPANGCGVHNPDQTYDYWSYWYKKDQAWFYSGIGPGGRTPGDGDVEGWHFVRGGGNPTDPPPGVDPTTVCPPLTTTTLPPTTTTTDGGGGGAVGGGGSRPVFHVTPTIKAGTSGQTTVEPGSTNDTIRGEALTEAESATSLDGEGFAKSDGSRNELATGEPGADGGGSSSGTGVPIAIAGGGVVIMALGVTAALRFRAEPED